MVTRQRLIEASLDVFSRQGFDGTSLSSIAEEAGVTQPTLNYHFGTKDQLYRDVISYCGTQWIAAVETSDDLRDLSQLDVLKVALRRLGRVIAGQKIVTVVVDKATGKIVTSFPTNTWKAAAIVGVVWIGKHMLLGQAIYWHAAAPSCENSFTVVIDPTRFSVLYRIDRVNSPPPIGAS